jgi:transcriptional regulator GlxA family with amidase domain
VLIIAFDGATTLDVTGPAQAFSTARDARGRPVYRTEVAANGGGAVETSAAVRVLVSDLRTLRPRRTDTIVVAGGGADAVRAAMADAALLAWLGRASRIARRVTSVCSGSFILAAAGLLDGKRATTHWQGCDALAQMFPGVIVEPKAIFVTDGSVWTSAGVSTGIDMSLAIIEQDLGRAAADAVAAMLVLYLRRPGFQTQFSWPLTAQAARSNPLGPALAWVRANLATADVESLARSLAVSVRTLHRKCLEHDTTPAKLIERVRVEHARTLLATTTLSVKELAVQSGFRTPIQMTRAFEREIGMNPRAYRLLHGRDVSALHH